MGYRVGEPAQRESESQHTSIAGDFTGGVESMRTWGDWQSHTTPIGLGGVEIPGASSQFGKSINAKSHDVGVLAQYEDGNLSLGFYGGMTMGSVRSFGGGMYATFNLSGCGQSAN